MYSTLVSVALFAAACVGPATASSDLQFPTPVELVQCKPVQLTWGKSSPPYDLVVVPAADPCNEVLVDLGNNHTSTSFTWNTNLKAGTEVVFSLLDHTGEEGWTGSVTIKASNDSSCLPEADRPKTNGTAVSSPVPAPTQPSTTLVVPPGNVEGTPSGPAAPGDTEGAVPVGAANAGLNPSSDAATHTFNRASVALSVLAAVVFAAVL